MDVRLPDGTIIKNVPDGTTKADLVIKLQRNGMAVPSEWLDAKPAQTQADPSVVEKVGSSLMEAPRQVGLFARYALEGTGQLADIGAEPIRRLLVNPIARKIGAPEATKTVGQLASEGADAIGLPSPQNATERVVGDATRLGFGAMTGSGLASSAARATNGTASAVLNRLAAAPTQQVVSAVGAGTAGGSVRESGGGPWAQLAASVFGGVTAPLAASTITNAAQSGARALRNTLAPQMVDRQVDNAINLTLQRQGINWADVDNATRQALRQEARQAVSRGEQLNGDAVRRLMDFQRVGATPTSGSLTLDPVQITRERNLAKMGANSSDASLQQLAQLENQNNGALIRNLNESGAAQARDPYATGESLINALNGYGAGQQSRVGALYGAARDSQGRDVVLNGPAAAQAAMARLQRDGVGKLPPEVDNWLNQLTNGETPLTVDYQQQLVKNLYRKMQGAGDNGDLRHGLRIIREALDNAPLMERGPANPGNLPGVPGSIPGNANQAAQEAIDAFRAGRSANRQLMAQREAVPALNAAMDGAQPDRFLRQFVIGAGRDANVANVEGLRNVLQSARINPENLPATAAQIRALPPQQGAQALVDTKNAIADHLKRAALNGAADEVGNFSQAAYNKALRDIGDRKLQLFFTPDEVARLHAVGRVASYLQAQPKGSAVNNSNSGAMLAGNLLDWVGTAASRLPLGLKDTISGTINSTQAARAMRPANALAIPNQAPPVLPQNLLMAPAIYGIDQSRQGSQ
jgi:hypothetical protein